MVTTGDDDDPQGFEPYLPPPAPPQANDALAEGDLTPPHRPYIFGTIQATAASAYTDGAGRYSFVQCYLIENSGGNVVPTELPEGVTGELSAMELGGRTDVPVDTVVTLYPAEFDFGEGWSFLYDGGDGLPSGGCSIPDETLRCDPATGKLHKWTRREYIDAGTCLKATDYVDEGAIACGGGGPDSPCKITLRGDRCVAGRSYTFEWDEWTEAGCLKKSDDRLIGPAGCGDPPYPPCQPVLDFDFRCLPYPGGSGGGAVRQARFVSRTYFPAGGCPLQTPYVFAGWTGVCCDCPPDPPTCPPCDTAIDTDCCAGVPCDLCLSLTAAGTCAAARLTLSYTTTPIDWGGEPVCGWTADPFSYGGCAFTAAVACLPATAVSPAAFWLMLTDLASGVAWFAPLGGACAPLNLAGTIPLAGGTCCGADNVVVTATLTPAPCADCLPVAACGQCPDGAPLSYTADLTALVAALVACGGDFGPLSGTHTLTWRGGCVWQADPGGGYSATLAYDDGVWVRTLQTPTAIDQSEVSDFTCCAGGTFTGGTYGPAGCDTTAFPPVTFAPVPDTCCGGGGISNACCDGVPATLYVTFGGALAYLGTVTLAYSGAPDHRWEGTAPGGGCLGAAPDVSFSCTGPFGWTLNVDGGAATWGPLGPEAGACGPLLVSYSGAAPAPCTGTATATVTETHP